MKKTTKKELRKAGTFLSITLALVFVLIPILFGKELNSFILSIIVILFIFSIFLPFKLLKPYIYWIKFGNFLSIFNKKAILVIFFYVLLTPFGLIIRIFKYINKIMNKKKTYYKISKEDNENFIDQY